ncbi:MAG TPA: ribosome assembly RNA-binding protein YhbY [Methylococcus sp.]|nr:ribosome assembly RNA-binding protein YhbY [Methylococcus sp.]
MNPRQIRELRARSHKLKPVVIVGQAGVTAAVLKEISLALDHHELIKVRVNAVDREQRDEMTKWICHKLGAQWVQTLGHVITLFRRAEQTEIKCTGPQ